MEIKKSEKNNFEFALHPGKILERYLKNLKMTQKELAIKTNINKTVINEIIKGKRSITLNIALRFEPIFEMPAKFWYNLQNDFDEALLRIKNKTTFTYELIDNSSFFQKDYKIIEREVKSRLNGYAI